jgi:quinoprotein glucose dehydrogenase
MRGGEVYQQTCAACHDAQLVGSATAPPLTGPDFHANWDTETVGALFDKIRQTMPGDNPGSLTPQQTADVVAFILNFNKYPSGQTELATSADPLQSVKIGPAQASAAGAPAQTAPAAAAAAASSASAPSPTAAAGATPGGAATTNGGIYTEMQSKRGADVYQQTCSACHDAQLVGSGTAPALTGADFNANWKDENVGSFFERIRQTMPGDNPGSLTPQQTADVVAFILNFNKYPAGQSELPPSADALRSIKFAPAQ